MPKAAISKKQLTDQLSSMTPEEVQEVLRGADSLRLDEALNKTRSSLNSLQERATALSKPFSEVIEFSITGTLVVGVYPDVLDYEDYTPLVTRFKKLNITGLGDKNAMKSSIRDLLLNAIEYDRQGLPPPVCKKIRAREKAIINLGDKITSLEKKTGLGEGALWSQLTGG